MAMVTETAGLTVRANDEHCGCDYEYDAEHCEAALCSSQHHRQHQRSRQQHWRHQHWQH
jgi:hypothetical protein